MIEVEKRSFITKDQYQHILKRLNSEKINLNETNQITYYFKGDIDYRIMLTNDFTKLWLKKGIIHSDAREEIEVKVDNQYKDNLLKMLEALGYEIEIKWFRKRIEGVYKGYTLTLDYSVGYGYIIEIESLIEDEHLIDQTKAELEKTLHSFNIEISSKEEFDNKYQDYKINWLEYTKAVDENAFLTINN